jgi:hypothetical protein
MRPNLYPRAIKMAILPTSKDPICEQRPRTVLIVVSATLLLFLVQVIWTLAAMPKSAPLSAPNPAFTPQRSATSR